MFAFMVFSIAAMVTPGPNNLMVMNSAINFGVRRTLPHYLGIVLGFPLLFFCVALGLGAVFELHAWLKYLLTYGGSAYMLYMAWKMAQPTSPVSSSTDKSAQQQATKNRQPLSFIQAVMFQWVNPKAWVMAVSATAIFHISANYFLNALLLSVINLLVCLPATGSWMWMGMQLKRFLQCSVRRLWFNRVMAIGLAGSILMVFFK